MNKKINWQWFLLFAYSLPLLLCFYWLFDYSNRGLDMTDESYYLLNTAQHQLQFLGLSSFGHYNSVLWQIAGGDISWFRRLGMLALLLSASYFTYQIHQYYRWVLNKPLLAVEQILNYIVANVLTLSYYFWWLPTPSYNWLALIGCFITAGALLQTTHLSVQHKDMSPSLSCLTILALGLFISFMNKPTTALVLGLFTLCWISFVYLKRHWLRVNLILLMLTVTLFIWHLLLFEQGIGQYWQQIKEGLNYNRLLSGQRSVSTLFTDASTALFDVPTQMLQNAWLSFVALALVLAFNLVVSFTRVIRPPWVYRINVVLLLLVILATWGQLWHNEFWIGGRYKGTEIGYAGFVLALSVCLGLACAKLPRLKRAARTSQPLDFRYLGILLLIMTLPMAYSFGSGNGILRQSSSAWVFYGMTAMFAVHWFERNSQIKVLGFVLGAVLLAANIRILDSGFDAPYRLRTTMAQQTEQVSFIGNPSVLYVNEATAKYINDLKKVAQEGGWQPKTPWIDLTGGTPLAAFTLDATPLKASWLFGGYGGSDEASLWLLGTLEPAQLKSAWVLSAPEGTIKLSTSLFDRLGINFAEHFEPVGELQTGYRNEKQILWRPKLSARP